MMHTTHQHHGRQPAALLNSTAGATAALLVAWLVAACGGDNSHEARNAGSLPATASNAASTPPLISDDGTAMPSDPRARPADAAAWTRSERYATEAQARQLLAALGDRALLVQVECCGAEAVEQAVGIAWGMQATGMPENTPVLVRGADLRLAAAAANRLSSGGMTHVWLVTP